MIEPKYIFPDDIAPLVAKAQESKTQTMRLYFKEEGADDGGEESGESRKQETAASEAGDGKAG